MLFEPTKSWLLAQHQWTKKATRRQNAWPPKQSLAKLATTLPTLAATSQKTTWLQIALKKGRGPATFNDSLYIGHSEIQK